MNPERIVVIDDNPNDAQLIKRVLENAGYAVTWASSGEEGLRIIPDLSPNCVLVDYRMPGLDGYEVCRRIKEDPTLQTIPVLMLTGADSSRNLVEGLDAGADDFVTKSSEIEVILARVRALLRVKAYQDRIVEQAAQLRQLYEELSHKSDKIMELNQRLNSDLQIARRVQEALLPERSFSTPRAEIRSAYIPSETLSGDFYDYFLQRDSLFLFVADVSGHGLPAAILVSLLKSFLHSEAVDSPSLPAFMASLNDFLVSASLPAQYATAQLLRLDPSGTCITFSNGAHPAFLHYRAAARKATARDRPGHLVGARPSLVFDEHRVEVAPGDLLFLYTDGLTDRRTASGEFYALDRVAAILEKEDGRELSAVYDAVYADVTGFPATDEFRDDIAFILTRLV